MADETHPNGAAEQAQQPQLRMQILAQFIRDLSFENAVAQKGAPTGEVQPEITVQVSLDARKRGTETQYEVITKYRVTSTNKSDGSTLFLTELIM
ncbi:MAG: protein-export chaperone SecB, partial [Alphaproteobacteria bacterium]|nr:protein-export chaperone SecB [Alphaproteobacteria bacterium]